MTERTRVRMGDLKLGLVLRLRASIFTEASVRTFGRTSQSLYVLCALCATLRANERNSSAKARTEQGKERPVVAQWQWQWQHRTYVRQVMGGSISSSSYRLSCSVLRELAPRFARTQPQSGAAKVGPQIWISFPPNCGFISVIIITMLIIKRYHI